MDRTLTVFVNSEFGKVRTLLIDNEPYFVGKDVAEILGYSNSKDALIKHVDEEDKRILKGSDLRPLENHIPKSVFPVEFIPADIPNRGLSIINESGLYSLILSSKLPGAKKFKHWVTSEVLPSIRKNGGYYIPQTYSEALQLCAEQTRAIEAMQPKADVYDKICNSETLKPVDQVASNLGYGKKTFFALMRGLGIFYYSAKDDKGNRVNLPKQEYKAAGYFVTKEEPFARGDENCLYTKIYITGKGETWLAKKINEEVKEVV